MTRAAGDGSTDAAAGIALLAADPSIPATTPAPGQGEEPATDKPGDTGSVTGDDGQAIQVLGDSAYGAGEMLEHLESAGHQALVKPEPLRPAVTGVYVLDDFAYDPENGTLTCPNQVVRTISAKGNVNFGPACKGCPLRGMCTKAKKGRKVVITVHHGRQRAHRAAAEQPGFQEQYRQYRPLIERSIAWVVAKDKRRLRYRGTEKNNTWLQTRLGALNLRKLLVMGLHQFNGAWVLARESRAGADRPEFGAYRGHKRPAGSSECGEARIWPNTAGR